MLKLAVEVMDAATEAEFAPVVVPSKLKAGKKSGACLRYHSY